MFTRCMEMWIKPDMHLMRASEAMTRSAKTTEFEFGFPDERSPHVYPLNGDVEQTSYSSDEGIGGDNEIDEDHGIRVQFAGREVPMFNH